MPTIPPPPPGFEPVSAVPPPPPGFTPVVSGSPAEVRPKPAIPRTGPQILEEEGPHSPTLINSRRIPASQVIAPVDDRSDVRKFLETPLVSPQDVEEAMPFLVGPFALHKGILKSAAGMTSPESAAILAGTGGLGMAAEATAASTAQAARVAQAGLSAYFATQAGRGLLEKAPELAARWKAGDWQGTLELGGQALFDGAVLAAATLHSKNSLERAADIGKTARLLRARVLAEEAARQRANRPKPAPAERQIPAAEAPAPTPAEPQRGLQRIEEAPPAAESAPARVPPPPPGFAPIDTSAIDTGPYAVGTKEAANYVAEQKLKQLGGGWTVTEAGQDSPIEGGGLDTVAPRPKRTLSPPAPSAPGPPSGPEGGSLPGEDQNSPGISAESVADTQQVAESGGGEPGWVGKVPTSEIVVDAPRFQFKQNVGQGGAGEELRGVRKWDPEMGGILSVWKDPADGKTYVVNGHHRVELANRAENRPEDMTVRYLNAPDAQAARLKGALINIGEGRGESTDAAKVFRDSQLTPEQIAERGVSIKGRIASEGLGISKLAQPIFDDVMDGSLAPARGAILGSVASHADQKALYDLIKQREKGGRRLTDETIRELIRMNDRTSTKTESTGDDSQFSMFGAEEITRSLLPEKAEVSGYVRRQLAAEKKLFAIVGNQGAADQLEAAGNVIKAGENAQVAERANQGSTLYDKLSTKAGPIDVILDRAARELADGENAGEVKQRAYREIRDHLTGEINRLTGVRPVDAGRTEGSGESGRLPTRAGQHDHLDRARAGGDDSGTAQALPAGRVDRTPPNPLKAAAARQALANAERAAGLKARVTALHSPAERTPVPTEGAKLPAHLQGAKPRYHFGLKAFRLNFASDLDKAAYISAQSKPSKQDAGFVEFVKQHTGLEEADIRKHGAAIKARIKELARAEKGGTVAKPQPLDVPEYTAEGPERAKGGPLFSQGRLTGNGSINPLAVRRVEGVPYDPEASTAVTETESRVEYQPPKAGGAATLWVNRQAQVTLLRMMELPADAEKHGMTFLPGHSRAAVDGLVRAIEAATDPAHRRALEALRRSILRASGLESSPRSIAIVQAGPEANRQDMAIAQQEEWDHILGLRLGGGTVEGLIDLEAVRNVAPAEVAAAESGLRALGYDEPAHDAHEIFVRLLRGRGEELTLSREQIGKLADAYVRILFETHGERANEAGQLIRESSGLARPLDASRLPAKPAGTERRETRPDPTGQAGKSEKEGSSGIPRRIGTPLSSQKVKSIPLGSERGSFSLKRKPLGERGPDFKAPNPLHRDIADFFKPVETRLRQEGTAGKELARKLTRAQDVGEITAGKRVVALRDSGLHELSKDDRRNLADALQGFATPKNAEVQKVFDAVRKVTDSLALEATQSGVKVRVKVTLRPGDPVPAGARLTPVQQAKRAAGERVSIVYRRPFQGRSNFYPHVIPSTDTLQEGAVRADVIDNLVRNGVVPNATQGAQFLDDYRKFVDEGGRAKELEKYLVSSGQARDAAEAFMLLQRFRKRGIKRQGSLEYSRQADLPFYDPDPGRTLPQFVTAASMRLAQVREFGQNNEQVNRLVKIIADNGGNENFVRLAVDRALSIVNEGDSAEARISRAVRMINGFKLGLSFIPNATQGALNSFLKSDLASTIAGAKGLLSKEGRRFAMQSGASLEGVINEMLRSVGTDHGPLGTFLKYSGFGATEQANRVWAANAGFAYATRMLTRLQKNPGDTRARAVLEELGLKPNVLLKLGKLDGDAALIAAKKFSDMTQFRGGVKDLPLFASTPLGKVVFQFKSFIYGQTRLVYRELVGELQAGRPGRAFRTLLILATVFPIAGEVVEDLRTWLKGGQRKSSGLKRYFEDVAQSGALGVAFDMMTSASFNKAQNFLMGPTLSDVADLGNAAFGGKDTDTKMRNLGRYVFRHIPLMGPVLYNRVFPKPEPMTPEQRKERARERRLLK